MDNIANGTILWTIQPESEKPRMTLYKLELHFTFAIMAGFCITMYKYKYNNHLVLVTVYNTHRYNDEIPGDMNIWDTEILNYRYAIYLTYQYIVVTVI